MKVGRLDGKVVNLAPEHADCERAARISGRAGEGRLGAARSPPRTRCARDAAGRARGAASRALGSAVVAFSGGVDSSRRRRDRLPRARRHARSPSPPSRPPWRSGELDGAQARGRRTSASRTRSIATNELARAGYRAQRPRPLLLLQVRALRRARRARARARLPRAALRRERRRPGRLAPRPASRRRARRRPPAARRRPRPQVRALARDAASCPSAEKPATPCLASRIPYGTAVDPETLQQIDRAERAVQRARLPGPARPPPRHPRAASRSPTEDLDRALAARARDRRRDQARRLRATR